MSRAWRDSLAPREMRPNGEGQLCDGEKEKCEAGAGVEVELLRAGEEGGVISSVFGMRVWGVKRRLSSIK